MYAYKIYLGSEIMSGIFSTTQHGQYRTDSYYLNGTTFSDIHFFSTLPSQSIAPAVSPFAAIPLDKFSSAGISSSDVIAKINGCMFDMSTNDFFGFFYQGPDYPMYIDGTAYYSASSIPSTSILYTNPKYYPSFCVRSNGSADIRWFSNYSQLSGELSNCDYIIGSAHPLVYNSKCVFNEAVYDQSGVLVYDSNNPSSGSARYNTGIDNSTARRTLLGHYSTGNFVFVVTESIMPMSVAANMMYDLGCDYAVNLDGGGSSQMRAANAYTGGIGDVSIGVTPYRAVVTAVCVYIK